MPSPHEVRRATTPLFSVALIVIGVAIFVRTLVEGVDGFAYGLLLGPLFVLAGAGRLWVSRRVGYWPDRPQGIARVDDYSERAGPAARRGLGSPRLFAIVYTSVASAIYSSLGVVAGHALGLTPFVFLAAGGYFVLNAMTYVEGASLHQERAGSTVFARYAFNELVSFVAGWAVLLDYVILLAITSYSATNYLGAYWHRLGEGWLEIAVAMAILVYVAVRNILGF